MADFPVSPEQLGTAYLSRILDAQVADFTWAPIGAGLVGDSARINLTYAPGHTGPPSIAAKFPAADPTSLATARMLKLYEKEVGFYSTVAPHVAIRTPAVYCAQWDGDTGDFLLLMEDMAPAKQGDQLASCMKRKWASIPPLRPMSPFARRRSIARNGMVRPAISCF